MEVYVYEKMKLYFTKLMKEIQKMSAQFDALKAQVEANNQLIESAITLIQTLADKILELKDDPAALEALAEQLKAEDATLAAAIAANTPAETPTP
jgi:chromosome segregation ATPase